ncbi:RNA-directed DNA polymerase, eukaryota, reverse transcriptase zinc-binding domain protein [Tanacetum coccineum]
MLTGKSTAMNCDVQKFNAIYNQTVKNRNRGPTLLVGENEDNLYTRVLTLFRDQNGAEFRHRDAWIFLKNKYKWTNPESTQARRTQGRVTGEDEHKMFGEDAIPRPYGAPRKSKSQRSSQAHSPLPKQRVEDSYFRHYGMNPEDAARIDALKEKARATLYRLEHDKDCLIINRIDNGPWSWNWSRTDIGVRNTAYLSDMFLEISLVDTHAVEDYCLCSMLNDGLFSIEVARRIIDSKLLPSLVPSTSWDKILPRKVNIFIWGLSLDRLSHRLNLSSRGIAIPKISCSSYNGNMESSNHVFFACDISMEVWRLVRN